MARAQMSGTEDVLTVRLECEQDSFVLLVSERSWSVRWHHHRLGPPPEVPHAAPQRDERGPGAQGAHPDKGPRQNWSPRGG